MTAGAAGTNPTVTNTGTNEAAVFDFVIPKGDTGAAGTFTPASPVADATSTTDVVTQFNALLASLRAAGILST